MFNLTALSLVAIAALAPSTTSVARQEGSKVQVVAITPRVKVGESGQIWFRVPNQSLVVEIDGQKVNVPEGYISTGSLQETKTIKVFVWDGCDPSDSQPTDQWTVTVEVEQEKAKGQDDMTPSN